MTESSGPEAPLADEVVSGIEPRHILDALADPVVAADATNRIVYVNDATAMLLGWSVEELLGQPLTIMQPERFRSLHLAAFERFLSTGVATILGHPIRVPALRQDGTEIDIELMLTAWRQPDGGFLAIASLRDLRERVALERELEITRYLRAVQTVTDAALLHLGLDDLLYELLRRVRSILSVDVATILLLSEDEQVLQVRASNGLEEEVREGVRIPIGQGVVGRVASTGTPMIVDDVSQAEVLSPHVRERARSLMGAPLLAEGRTIGVIHVDSFEHRQFTQDDLQLLRLVADRIAAPIERARLYEGEHRARTEAEAARQRSAFLDEASRVLASSLDYQTTLTNVAQLVVPQLADWCAIHVVEEDGTVRPLTTAHTDPAKVALARELETRYPYDPDAPYGVSAVIRSRKSELTPEISDAMLAGASRDPEILAVLRGLGLRSSMLVPLVARDRVLGAITFVSAESGRRYGSADLALAEELARRAAMAVDNARLYQEAQDALRMRDDLLSSVTHDLKNPLTAIKGQAQVLQRRAARLPPESGERLVKGLENISDTAARMNRLINDLVDMARLRMGHPLDLTYGPTDLVALARASVEDQQRTAGHRIRLESDVPDLIGSWDGFRLERVLDNLIANAVKYSPEGGPITVRIWQEEGPNGAVAALSVEDRGLGILPDDLPNIFERFYRGANVVGRIAGTGIGLAGAKQIVEQHGGSISVGSDVGQGTTFTIRLPVGVLKGE